MPKITRRPVRLLPTMRKSGLLLRSDGEYFADIRINDGLRIRRKLGQDETRAFALILADIAHREEVRENPLLVDFMRDEFLPSQQRLKRLAFTRERVGLVPEN